MSTLIEHMERCVKCGSCKATCPTYAAEHMEAMTARGRVILVRALARGEIRPSKALARRLYSCMLCGLCEPLCPVGVDVTAIVYEGLRAVSSHDPRGRITRRLAREAFTNTERAFGLGKMLKPLVKALAPFDITLPPRTLRSEGDFYAPSAAHEAEPRGRVGVFLGCASNYIYQDMGRALIRTLTAMGYEAVLPKGEVCCGAPLRAMGMEEEATGLAKENVRVFGELEVHAVVSPCPTCTLAIREHYPSLIGEAIEGALDPLEFMASRLGELPKVEAAGPVMYHEPCHLGVGLGAGGKAREVMRAMGLVFSEPEDRTCCGFGLASVYPKDSAAQLGRLEYPEGSTVITACPGCAAQLSRRYGSVRQLLDLLA